MLVTLIKLGQTVQSKMKLADSIVGVFLIGVQPFEITKAITWLRTKQTASCTKSSFAISMSKKQSIWVGNQGSRKRLKLCRRRLILSFMLLEINDPMRCTFHCS